MEVNGECLAEERLEYQESCAIRVDITGGREGTSQCVALIEVLKAQTSLSVVKRSSATSLQERH